MKTNTHNQNTKIKTIISVVFCLLFLLSIIEPASILAKEPNNPTIDSIVIVYRKSDQKLIASDLDRNPDEELKAVVHDFGGKYEDYEAIFISPKPDIKNGIKKIDLVKDSSGKVTKAQITTFTDQEVKEKKEREKLENDKQEAQTPGFDLAEGYETTDQAIEAGDVVSVFDDGIRKSNKPYDRKLMGIISTDPGILLDGNEKANENKKPVALSGRVPVKVSTENGPIEAGDYLTSSSTPGVAMKATRPGPTVGKALEEWTCEAGSGNVDNEVGSRINPTSYFNNPDSHLSSPTSCQGKILTFVNVSWYDPRPPIVAKAEELKDFLLEKVEDTETLLASQGQALEREATGATYLVRDSTGKVVDRTEVLGHLLVANLRAGAITAKQATVEQFDALTANVEQLTALSANVTSLAAEQLTAKSLTSPIAQIDELRTDLISPLASGSLRIHLGGGRTDSPDGGRLIVENAEGTEVASIDNQGNATFEGEVTANELTVNELTSSDATVSGTLRAGKIVADEIEGLEARLATLSAQTITNNITTITNITQIATPSASQGETLEATPSADLANQEAGSMNQAEIDSAIAAISNSSFIIPDSNLIDISSFSTQLAYIEELEATSAVFTQGLISYGLSSFSNISVSQTFSIGTNFILTEGSIDVLGEDLALQNLRQGGVSIAGGLVYFDKDGNATISGNLAVEGDATVKGELAANIIKPIPDGDLIIQFAKTDTSEVARRDSSDGERLIVKNASGSAILQVNQQGDLTASGSAVFANLLSKEFKIAREAQADISPVETEASSSAGIATIVAGQTRRTIITPFVTEDSLIYLTLTSDLQGVYPSIAQQTPEDLPNNVRGSFTISIPRAVRQDITINWLIVN